MSVLTTKCLAYTLGTKYKVPLHVAPSLLILITSSLLLLASSISASSRLPFFHFSIFPSFHLSDSSSYSIHSFNLLPHLSSSPLSKPQHLSTSTLTFHHSPVNCRRNNSILAMMVRAKRPARSARQSQGTATSTVMLVPNPTQTVVRINQTQSLHIIQTTVSAALNTILWINNLFPDNYFETRSYSLNDPAFPYRVKTPVQVALEGKQQRNDKTSVTWNFLAKGKTAKADKIWSWLVRFHSPFIHRSRCLQDTGRSQRRP